MPRRRLVTRVLARSRPAGDWPASCARRSRSMAGWRRGWQLRNLAVIRRRSPGVVWRGGVSFAINGEHCAMNSDQLEFQLPQRPGRGDSRPRGRVRWHCHRHLIGAASPPPHQLPRLRPGADGAAARVGVDRSRASGYPGQHLEQVAMTGHSAFAAGPGAAASAETRRPS
jgi:hypothetical protein